MTLPLLPEKSNRTVLKTRHAIAGELLGLSTGAHLTAILLVKYIFGIHTWRDAHQWTLDAGSTLITEASWIYGVNTTILIALYALVFGGQIAVAQGNAEFIRRRAGWTALAITALLSPALSMMLYTSIQDPSRHGLLFVLAPTTGILVVLSASVGRFTAADVDVQRRLHERSITSSQAALNKLPRTPRRNILASITLNTTLSTLLPILIMGLIYQTPIPPDVLITFTAAGFALTAFGVFGIFLTCTTIGKFEFIFGEIMRWCPCVLMAVILLSILFDRSSWEGASLGDQIAWGLTFAWPALFFAASAWIPTHPTPPWVRHSRILNFTIRSGAQSLARHFLTSTIKRSQRELAKLQTDNVKTAPTSQTR